MACFIVPAAEAVVTSVITRVMEKKEEKNEKETDTPRFSEKIKWLNNMLWGGSGLLAFEHLWHGEIVPYFPFLTAAGNADSLRQMLHEMATTGVCMSAVVTVAWGMMLAVSSYLQKSAPAEKIPAKEK